MLITTGRFINPSTAALTSLIAAIIGVKSIDGPDIDCDDPSPPKLVPATTVSLLFNAIVPSGDNIVRLPYPEDTTSSPFTSALTPIIAPPNKANDNNDFNGFINVIIPMVVNNIPFNTVPNALPAGIIELINELINLNGSAIRFTIFKATDKTSSKAPKGPATKLPTMSCNFNIAAPNFSCMFCLSSACAASSSVTCANDLPLAIAYSIFLNVYDN